MKIFSRDVDGDFSIIELIRLRHMLAECLHAEVDLTTSASLHPVVRDQAIAKAERVF